MTKILIDEALDKMAENARELGLSYEQPAQPYCYTYTENGEEFFAPPTAYVPENAIALYTSPPAPAPAQPWVGLTDEEIIKCWGQVSGTRCGYVAFARAVEAKLKKKNTKGGAS